MSLYKPEYNEQARKLCMMGATDKEIGDFFGVDERTINRWKTEYPDFCQSIKDGKIKADALVAHSLYHRAIGYKHDAVKILTVADGNNLGSHVESVPYIERYPPDTTAAIFWLKNRRPQDWRDKQEIEVDDVSQLTPEDRTNRVAALLTSAKQAKQRASVTNGNGTNGNGNGKH